MTYANLTDAQVRLASAFIDRAGLTPNYRLMKSSDRYQRMIELVTLTIDDGLIAACMGSADLVAVRAYFVAMRDAFIATGK